MSGIVPSVLPSIYRTPVNVHFIFAHLCTSKLNSIMALRSPNLTWWHCAECAG
jgi:hypothetical protein